MPSTSYANYHYFYLNVANVPNTVEGKFEQLSDKPGTIHTIFDLDNNTRANAIGTLRDDDENGTTDDEHKICNIEDNSRMPVGANIPFNKLRLVYKDSTVNPIVISSAVLHKMIVWKDNDFGG